MEEFEMDEDLSPMEKLSPSERFRQSKKKRSQQLKKYTQYEKQLEKTSAKAAKKPAKGPAKKVQFVTSVKLLEAAARNDFEEVEHLLKMGVDPSASNEDGLTALHQCCIDDSEAMLKLLVEHGADVNACDSELWTPLHAAATCANMRLCQILIEHGADVLAVNGDGNMPYDICEDENTLDFIEAEMAKKGITQEIIDDTRLLREKAMLADLVEHVESGGNVRDYCGRNGETLLHIAASNGYIDVSQYILSHLMPVDVVDKDMWQPIHCAACWGQLGVLELLLEFGAKLDAKTRHGETAIDICEDLGMKQQILEIKDAVEMQRVAKSREISRKHSSCIRSASIRRTSMREKKEMSMKEAKEEGRMLQESSSRQFNSTEDDDSMDGQTSFCDTAPLPTEPSERPDRNPRSGPGIGLVDIQMTVTDAHGLSQPYRSNSLDFQQVSGPMSPVKSTSHPFSNHVSSADHSTGDVVDGPKSNEHNVSNTNSTTSSEKLKTSNSGVAVVKANGLPSTSGETLPELKKRRLQTHLNSMILSDMPPNENHQVPDNQSSTARSGNEHPNSSDLSVKTSTLSVAVSKSDKRDQQRCCVLI